MVEKLCCLSVERVHSFLHINDDFLARFFRVLNFCFFSFKGKERENFMKKVNVNIHFKKSVFANKKVLFHSIPTNPKNPPSSPLC